MSFLVIFRFVIFSEGVRKMQLLEQRILRDGKVKDGGVLKVDSFLNHQMDVGLFGEMAKEFYRLFRDENVNKILTIEASGIGIACITAQVFGCPVIFAKKTKTKNIAGDVYTSKVESFTHSATYDIIVSKEFLGKGDRVLIIDDFLANGSALSGLCKLVSDAQATLVGAGIAIEKAFQPGGELLRGRGIKIESLAKIRSMDGGKIIFC
jgi:xanthine phosphoribosyltransferase